MTKQKESVWAPHSDLDVVAVTVLTGLVLSGLWPSFAGWKWMAVAAVGLVVGIGWSLLLIRLRQGIDLVLMTLLAPYLFTAGGVALGLGGRFMLPGEETVGEVLVGTLGSWRRLVETAPPVDGEGVVLLVPYALALFVGGAATVMALRSRRPSLPLVPLLLMLGIVQVLGLHDPLSVIVPALGFAALALAWVAHRGNRVNASGSEHNPAAVGFSFGRVVARGVLIVLAVAVVTPLVEGTQGIDRWLVREAVTPYDPDTVSTPLSDFRQFRMGSTNSLARKKLFRVDGVEPGTLVRIAVLDTYDGDQWRAIDDQGRSDDLDRFLRVPSRMDNPASGKRLSATFQMLRPWELGWLPVIGRVQSFHFHGDDADQRREDLRYNRSTSTAILPGGLAEDEQYVVATRLPNTRLRPEMRPWPERNEKLWQAAEFLDEPVRLWSQGAPTPMQALFQVARELKERGRYTNGLEGWETQFRSGHDQERLDEEFIRADIQAGNDEQYAAAMALMANRLGIPARVVVGAPVRPLGHVKGKHVRAWVEVRIRNGSWRILPTEKFMSRRPPDKEERLESLAPRQREQPKRRREQLQEQREQEKKQEEEEKRDEEEEEKERTKKRRWWLLLLLTPGIPPGAKAVRRLRRRRSALVSRRFTGAWDEVLDTARDLGLGVAMATRGRQASALGVPVALARQVDVAAFSATAPPVEQAEAFWDDASGVQGELRARVPRWRQVLAWFNPASLLPRRH